MQTEWSSGRNDEPMKGFASSAAPVEPLVEGVAPAFEPPPAGPVSDGTTDEEAAHRSEVDAVDRLLDEVELAMARLDDGTYGRCEMCGELIDDVELAAGPLVRECMPCSAGALAFDDA